MKFVDNINSIKQQFQIVIFHVNQACINKSILNQIGEFFSREDHYQEHQIFSSDFVTESQLIAINDFIKRPWLYQSASVLNSPFAELIKGLRSPNEELNDQ